MGVFDSMGNILMDHLRPMADGKKIISLLNEFSNVTLDAVASVLKNQLHKVSWLKNNLFINKDCIRNAISDSTNDLNKSLVNILSGVQILLFDRLIAVIFAFKIIKYFIIECMFP